MKRWKDALSAAMLCALIAMLAGCSDAAKGGARQGMALCEEVLIPSLLPIMILSNTLLLSCAGRIPGAVFGRFVEAVLHLPKAATGAIIMGLTCGYPTGAMLTASLLENGKISREEAVRIMRFNLCGGIAFTVSAVGRFTLRSAKTGAVLLFVNILSALLCAVLSGAVNRRRPLSRAATESGVAALDALPDAALASVKGLAMLCGFVVFFSALTALVHVPPALLPLLEITGGLCRNETAFSLPMTAFFLSFGGFCVHLQLLGCLRRIGMRYAEFFAGRVLCASISYALCLVYVRLFPSSSAVFSNLASPQPSFSEGSMALGIVMMAGCAVLVYDLKNRKLKFA